MHKRIVNLACILWAAKPHDTVVRQRGEISYKDLMNVYKLEMSLDQKDNAELTLDEIRSIANTLPAEEAEDLFFFCDVNDIYINSFDETTGDSVLMANKELLFEAASRTSVEYSALAEILYSQTTDSVFFEYTPLPVDIITPKNFVVNENNTDIFTPEFKVYPNPTKGLVFVEYNFDKVYGDGSELLLKALNLERQDNCKTGTIRVYNSESKLIETIRLENASGFETINLNQRTAGLYLIEITDCYGNTNSVKVVKNQ